MKDLKYLIIAFLTLVTLTLATTPSMARKSGFGGGHRGGHGGFHKGHGGGHRGHFGHRGGHRAHFGSRGGHRGWRGGHRFKHRHGYGYYRPFYRPYYRPYYYPYAYYWPYFISPFVFGASFYYQYSRPVYYPTYPNPVSQQVIVSPQAQAPAQIPETQAVPQEQSGTYQIIVKDRYGNPQTINIPRGQTVTISEGRDGEVHIDFEGGPTSQQAIPRGDTMADNYENGSPGPGSGIPLKQTDAFGISW